MIALLLIGNTHNNLSQEEKNLIRASAYHALEKYQIENLPYTNSDIIKNLYDTYFIRALDLLAPDSDKAQEYSVKIGGYGAVYYSTNLHRYLFFFNRNIPDDYLTWTFAAFIASVELDLIVPDELFKITEGNLYIDEFVLHFTAPDPILKKCGITSPLDIANTCNIPFKYARDKSRNLRKRFTITALDEYIKFLFRKFIDNIHN